MTKKQSKQHDDDMPVQDDHAIESDTTEIEQHIGELTLDLQRVRADFENYRKRAEVEKNFARASGAHKATQSMLPVLDTIAMAIAHTPEDIADHKWVKGIVGVQKQLDKALGDMKLERIDASEGVVFNPELHQAVQFDEEAEGESEVIKAELQAGYMLDGTVLRPSMVHVTRQ